MLGGPRHGEFEDHLVLGVKRGDLRAFPHQMAHDMSRESLRA